MRRLVVVLLCALMLGSGLASVASASSGGSGWAPLDLDRLPPQRSTWWPEAQRLTASRESAMAWLDGQQAWDGTWGEDYGVTAVVAFAMLNGGRGPDHPVVAAALDALLAEARSDGSFSEGTYVHYYTSTAVMALSASGLSEHEALVRDGVAMLVREQCDGDEEGFEEWWRGGIGYGGDGRPDISNTQFALMALAAAGQAYDGVHVPASTWQSALVFLHRCQNLPGVNDLQWDDDTANPSFGDGGFAYFPGRSNAGGLSSYGSVTAAGLWCLMAAGEDLTDPASDGAFQWLATNFDAGSNPGFGDAAYYYYVWALARALRSAGAASLVSPDGDTLHWARELADGLLAKQAGDGSWRNIGSDAYWEGRPEVATAFALLAVEAMMPSGASLRLRADGGSISVTDPVGRRDAEIPGWYEEADGTVVLGDASQGPFDVEVRGTDTVEVGAEVDGTVRIWRDLALQRPGGRMTLDVAPLLGPASVVVSGVSGLPGGDEGDESSGGGVLLVTIAAVALVAAGAGLVNGRRRSR